MKILKIIVVILFLIISGVFTFGQTEDEIRNEIDKETKKFREILELAYKNYVDSVDIKKTSETAFNALLKDLDAHSQYYNSELYKKITDSNLGSTIGVGLNLTSLNDTITVLSIVHGGPADSAQMRVGDKVLFINGENTYKTSNQDCLKKLQGEKGTEVVLIIKRGYSQNLREIKLQRNEIPIPSINTSFIIYDLDKNRDIGYIKSNRFSKTSFSEFLEAAHALKKLGMKKLIFDLRGNPGGYLEQVTKIADEFLPEGNKITYTSARNQEYRLDYVSSGKGEFEDIPLVILIDGQSASASEIFSGAMQDLDRGIVIGSTSYGKATVQKTWQFKDGSAFSLTVARYFTPLGRGIHKILLSDKDKPKLDPTTKLSIDEKSRKKIEEMLDKNGGRTSLPSYTTGKGRIVLGGGGIFPDYFIIEDTTTALVSVMKSHGLFLEYVYFYINENWDNLINSYGDDYNKFNKEFDLNKIMIDDFIRLSKSHNIWNEKMYIQDSEYIYYLLKATLAHALWGDKGYYCVISNYDKTILEAQKYMTQAINLLNKK